MKLTRRVFASVVLLLSLVVYADAGDGDSFEKTFMWKVEDGKTRLFLLGSIHALREDAYPLPQTIESAFDQAEVVVFEIDVEDLTKASIKMMSAGTLEQGRTLEEVVGPEIWFELKVHASPLASTLQCSTE